MSQSLRLALVAAVSLVILTTESCRSRRKSVNVENSAPTVDITLVNVDDTFKNEPTLGYRIACGTSEMIAGKFTVENHIDFTVKGLKVKDVCQVSVNHLSPPANMKFIKESGKLYESDRFAINSTAVGKLVGTAVLGPLFQYESKGAAFVVPIKFGKDEKMPDDSSELRASVVCEPSIAGVSDKMTAINIKEKSGSFLFSGGVIPKQKYKCGTMLVRRAAGAGYFGDFKEEFTLLDGDHKTAKLVTLTGIPQTPSGVTVITEAAGGCKDDEVFDLKTRACVKK
jgi:hypothetical protein